MQTESERRLLLYPYEERFQEIHSISVNRQSARIHMRLFWSISSAWNFLKIDENPRVTPRSNKHRKDYCMYLDDTLMLRRTKGKAQMDWVISSFNALDLRLIPKSKSFFQPKKQHF